MGYRLRLRIPGIPGGCTEETHRDWIEVSSFSQGVSRGGEDRFSELHHDFSVTKHVDRASPLLAQACAEGWKVGEVTLEVSRSEGARPVVMRVRLWDVHLTQYQLSGTGDPSGSNATPFEGLSFRYGKVEWHVEPTSFGPQGTEAARPVCGSWTSDTFQEHPTRKC